MTWKLLGFTSRGLRTPVQKVYVLSLLVILCRLVCPMVFTKQVLAEPYGPMCIHKERSNGCYQSWLCRVWGESSFFL